MNIEISLYDSRVSNEMNMLLVIANILNIVYNIPQLIHTYRTKSTDDLNKWFIILRIVGNTIWILYSIYIDSFLMLLNNSVTVCSSIFIGYYKCKHYIKKKKENLNDII